MGTYEAHGLQRACPAAPRDYLRPMALLVREMTQHRECPDCYANARHGHAHWCRYRERLDRLTDRMWRETQRRNR